MSKIYRRWIGIASFAVFGLVLFEAAVYSSPQRTESRVEVEQDRDRDAVATSRKASTHDVSKRLSSMAPEVDRDRDKDNDKDGDGDNEAEEEAEREAEHEAELAAANDPDMPAGALAPQARNGAPASTDTQAIHGFPAGSKAVEQTTMGTGPAPTIVASFDGLGVGFEGPQGTARLNNPSDNALAVGPDHIVQIVNSKMAVFTKKGKKYNETGRVLYGPVNTNNVFKGFAGAGGHINGGDAVVRYDQLADRWLIVMPIFTRLPPTDHDPEAPRSGEPARRSVPAVAGQPGNATELDQPARPADADAQTSGGRGRGRGARGLGRGRGANGQTSATRGGGRGRGRGANGAPPAPPRGTYAMCYAISTSPDPLGTYYRYEFVRPLFPDYPRPAIWPDGYYIPSSTGDTVIQKQAFIADRTKMLKGEDATEQGLIIDGVNFLNNADIDGKQIPPAGAPNIMMAAGGSQLKHELEDDGIYYWKFHVDWDDPNKTKAEGPTKITVAPYHYMAGGQLTSGIPQPGTERGLDAQGDKLMQRLIYRRIGDRESLVVTHSINTTNPGGGGGVRWYEFRLDAQRNPVLYQQSTYAPGGNYRWLASAAMDKFGNIGIGYSFGGTPNFPGQRFAARRIADPLGELTLKEVVLAEGEDVQTNTNRWEDYSSTCMDPSDDRTIWYVGDYYKKGATSYSSRIGGFVIPESR